MSVVFVFEGPLGSEAVFTTREAAEAMLDDHLRACGYKVALRFRDGCHRTVVETKHGVTFRVAPHVLLGEAS